MKLIALFTAFFSISTAVLSSESVSPVEVKVGDVSSYNGQTAHTGARIWIPKDLSEVQAVVRAARKSKTPLKVKASSHSINSLILSDGEYLSTEKLTGIISIQNLSVKVKAGTKLGGLSEELRQKGLSLGFGYPAYKGLTIGGLLATGAHGSSRKHIGVSSQNILEMTIVDGTGEIRVLTPKDGKSFRAAQVHLGLLGVVHDVTLRIYPDFNLRYDFIKIPEFLNAKGEAQFGKEADSEIVMWSPVSNLAVKYAGHVVNLPESPLASNHLLGTSDEPSAISEMASGGMLSLGQRMTGVNARIESSRLEDAYDEPFILRDPSVKDANVSFVGSSSKLLLAEFFQPIRSFTFLDMEFAFPLSEASAVLATVREIALREKLHFPISRGLFLRFGKSVGVDGPLMSHAERPGASSEIWVFVSIVDYLSNDQSPHGGWSDKRDRFLQELNQKHRLHLHWGKNSDQIFGWFNPKAEASAHVLDFKEQVKSFDPESLFSNGFAKALGIAKP